MGAFGLIGLLNLGLLFRYRFGPRGSIIKRIGQMINMNEKAENEKFTILKCKFLNY